MNNTTWFAPVILALALSGSGAAAAQDGSQTQTLQDGRTVVVATETAVCGKPSPYPDARFALALQFDCHDDVSGVQGAVFLGVASQPGETTPREYLAGVAQEYWPQLTETERAEQIHAGQFEFAGQSAEMLCIAGNDQGQTVGRAACVLNQPKTQMIFHMRSTGQSQALGVMLMVLTGLTIR